MRLMPYISVDDTPFTLTPAELQARRGPPLSVVRSDIGLHEHDYGDVVFRFQDSGRLEEVTRRAPVLHLALDAGDVAVPFTALSGFVQHQDAGAFERAGFIVSPAFGFTFVPTSPNWVTALARHCMPTWRAMT